MSYHVELSDNAIKALKKIDKQQAKLIVAWIEKNLENCDNPRMFGKPLVEDMSGYWSYRLGNYRILADIQDRIVRIEIINVGHRKDIYD